MAVSAGRAVRSSILAEVNQRPDTRVMTRTKHASRHKTMNNPFTIRLSGVPIFNYHGLAERLPTDIPQAARRFWVAPSEFRHHLEHIRQQGFRVAQLEDVLTRAEAADRTGGTVVLTFDDGRESDYTLALPLLAESRAVGIFFVNTSTIGKLGYLTWSQIKEMQRAGMSIQSHGHLHLDLTILPTDKLQSEIAVSKHRLEDKLSAPVEFLAAPHGLVSRRVIRIALAAGYRAVCSTRSWPAKPHCRVLPRIPVHRAIPPDDFHGLLMGDASHYALRSWKWLLYRPRRLADHMLGVWRYRWLMQNPIVTE